MTASMPMKVCWNPEPGMLTNGQLKPVAIALASIVLPVPGGPKKSRPRSRLPPAASNASPDCHSETTRLTSSLASFCPRTSPSRTPQSASPGSNPLICVIPTSMQRPQQDQEVEEEEDREDDRVHQELRLAQIEREPIPDSRDVLRPGQPFAAGDEQADEPDHREERNDEDDPADPLAPEPGAASVDDVLLLEPLVDGSEEARPGDEAPNDDVDDAAEEDHRDERPGQRPAEVQVGLVVQPDEDRGARQDRDQRRAARESSPLVAEL